MTEFTYQKHQVKNGKRLISFEGVKLGFVTSEYGGKARWSEMAIYKTINDYYVLEKVGRSVVTHIDGCSDVTRILPRFQEAHPGDDPDYGYEYHEACVPDEYDFTKLLVEEDWYWACFSENVKDIVDALFRRKGGSKMITKIGTELLEQAAQHDGSFGMILRNLL